MEIAMNWDIFSGRWKQHKGNLKVRWGKFNDDHFGVIDGRRIQLSGRTQETYGISRERMRNKQKGSA